MKIVRVGGPRHALSGQKCRHCNRVCQKGQVVLDHLMVDGPPNNNHFVLHVRCCAALVRKAPADHDEVAFNEHRDRILTTGDPYTE